MSPGATSLPATAIVRLGSAGVDGRSQIQVLTTSVSLAPGYFTPHRTQGYKRSEEMSMRGSPTP